MIFVANAYIVSGEDSHQAKQVPNWTYEQYLTALENMNRKISRLEAQKNKDIQKTFFGNDSFSSDGQIIQQI